MEWGTLLRTADHEGPHTGQADPQLPHQAGESLPWCWSWADLDLHHRNLTQVRPSQISRKVLAECRPEAPVANYGDGVVDSVKILIKTSLSLSLGNIKTNDLSWEWGWLWSVLGLGSKYWNISQLYFSNRNISRGWKSLGKGWPR